MNATASPQQEFYNAYKESGLIVGELVPSSIIALISVAGWFFNYNLIYATLRHKSLHGTCNVLLAISAFCDTLIELSNLIWFGVTVTGTNFLPLGTCVKLNTIPLIGVSGSIVLMFLVSFDRLISVLMPQV
ncbi:hypothetical protein AAVH_25496 [Aphelenchoides avenae]|nr:hypothetical protein AAVH_25496 [Aphelenchus avenae]